MTRLRTLALALLPPVVFGGCGKVFEYPDSEPEQGAELCSDGEDNDFDGSVDCADADCDGFCGEETPSECSDGRDNDGDGLTDGGDPRCWLIAPPEGQRCAETSGVEAFETFDATYWRLGFDPLTPAWTGYGAVNFLGIRGARAATGSPSLEVRTDPLLSLVTGDFGVSSDGIATVARLLPFSGSWQGFTLSFEASVAPGGLLRAGVVPIELSPLASGPVPGAESIRLAVTVDASLSSPTLALEVDGAREVSNFPVAALSCNGASCRGERFGRLSVELDGEGFVARLRYPDGYEAEVRGPSPRTESLPPSRLVFRGGSPDGSAAALVDDLRLSVKPEWPCGYPVPQIPGSGCEFDDRLEAFGHGVSVARGADGKYCALVAASAVASAGPEVLTAWHSVNGENWTPVSSVDTSAIVLPEGSTLIGAGIAHGEAGYEAAVAYREPRGEVRLGLAEGSDCESFGELTNGTSLSDDAEAPSYVIRDNRREVYFTRPPKDALGRTLWRIGLDDERPQAEVVTELPADVGAPASVSLVGTRDLVLAYPIVGNVGPSVVGLLVLDETLGARSIDPARILERPPALDLPGGQGRLSFDDRGVVAAALAWDEQGGFLLYGGRATHGGVGASRDEPILSVGTARLVSAGEPLPATAVVPEPSCGDGVCAREENCAGCAVDCPCDERTLLSDAFASDLPWSSASPIPFPIRYRTSDPPEMNFSGGPPTWSSLPLERALTGDFELSFDALLAFTRTRDGACSVYVGLGSSSPAPLPGIVAPEVGVFARLTEDYACKDKYFAAPFVARAGLGSSAAPSADGCADDSAIPVGRWRHVVLRRTGSTVSVIVPAADGCGSVRREVTYPGALPELAEVLIGFGGAPFSDCFEGASGTIRHVELRLIDDPKACAEGKELCGASGEQPSCVDTARSSEHCGACAQACGDNETCFDGVCACSDLPGILDCDGVCVDSFTSSEHCGACANACAGACVRGSCETVVACPMMPSFGDPEEPAESDVPIVPAPEGHATLHFEPGGGVMSVCGTLLYSPTLVAWTRTGGSGFYDAGVIELEFDAADLDAASGVTTVGPFQGACATWLACSHDVVNLDSGPEIEFSPVRGQPYLIAVGTTSPVVESRTAELRIRVE